MLQQVTAEVQPRLVTQVNTSVSLDRTRMVSITFSNHFCSWYMTKHISHTCARRSCRPARYLSSSTHSHTSERFLATALRVSSSITTGHNVLNKEVGPKRLGSSINPSRHVIAYDQGCRIVWLWDVSRLTQIRCLVDGSINLLRSRPLRRTYVRARHIVPPLSPSQPVIPDEKIICSGKEPSRSSLLSLLFATFFFCFFPRFFVVSRFNPQFYCINLRTASTREQPSIGPAQSSRVHTVVRACGPEATTQASRHERASQVLPRAIYCKSILCFVFSSLNGVSSSSIRKANNK